MKIFCSGIGGIGLSAYASLQKSAGHEVSGSDRSESALIDDVRRLGIAVTMHQDGFAISSDTDLFVYSEAIAKESPERRRAEELGIPSQSYFQALGHLSRGKRVIAVCGTHGKSSTTAMAARVLIDAGLDPTVVVGTKVRELGGRNWRKGTGDIFLVEACEYRKSFLFLDPSIVLMTNVDGDHFDAFASIEDYRQAFVDFLRRLSSEGVAITHGDDPACASVAEASGRNLLNADRYPMIALQTPGLHMRQNAQLVLALADHLGLDATKTKQCLSRFSGTWRRMEVKGIMKNGATVIDDYAHHPVEIRATLSAMQEAYPQRRIICVFQPHTHDRTFKLYDAFTTAFGDADLVIIPTIYHARSEIETKEVDVDAFIADIAAGSTSEARNGRSMSETEAMVRAEARAGDVVITMGAGDITALADRLLKVFPLPGACPEPDEGGEG